ncbi:MAG: hemerythrin family protein, partial [Victivallales bacterium]|nr:hemerythrin family protein [Victivallales bacterium]
LMSEAGYPGLEQHRKIHQYYLEKNVQFCFAAMADVKELTPILKTYLYDWLIQHVLVVDHQYKPYLTRSGEKDIRK